MSLKVAAYVWGLALPPPEKLVLLRLADHAHDDGSHVFPSLESVAERCGLSKRQVRRYLSRFVERGLLAIEANPHGGRGKARVYRFTFIIPDTMVSAFMEQNPDIGDAQTRTWVTTNTDMAMSPQPS
jgi:MarR-like DNA-binding transcriptional regulator SgrR of sgrS sRNA